MLFGETFAVCCENHMEHTNTHYGQNAGFYHVKVGGAYKPVGFKGLSEHSLLHNGQ
jgi:hypothetical protein